MSYIGICNMFKYLKPHTILESISNVQIKREAPFIQKQNNKGCKGTNSF